MFNFGRAVGLILLVLWPHFGSSRGRRISISVRNIMGNGNWRKILQRSDDIPPLFHCDLLYH